MSRNSAGGNKRRLSKEVKINVIASFNCHKSLFLMEASSVFYKKYFIAGENECVVRTETSILFAYCNIRPTERMR